jgi:hypothetical protein
LHPWSIAVDVRLANVVRIRDAEAMQGTSWRTCLAALAMVTSACGSSATRAPDMGPSVEGDASVHVVGAVLQPVTSWTLHVTEIDFRGSGGSLPGFVLNPSYGPCARTGLMVNNAFAELVDAFADLSTTRYPSLDLETLAREALGCEAGPDCAALSLLAHSNSVGATWVHETGQGVRWGPLDARAGFRIDGLGQGEAALEIPALDEAGDVVMLRIALSEVRLAVARADSSLIEITVGGLMDEPAFLALSASLQALGASDALLDDPSGVYAVLVDVGRESGSVCPPTALSVGFTIRARATPDASLP